MWTQNREHKQMIATFTFAVGVPHTLKMKSGHIAEYQLKIKRKGKMRR